MVHIGNDWDEILKDEITTSFLKYSLWLILLHISVMASEIALFIKNGSLKILKVCAVS